MNQDTQTAKKVPPNLFLTSVLSASITIGLSVIYSLLSLAFLLLRGNCDLGKTESTTGADYFWQIIFRVYVLSEDCDETAIIIEKLTSELNLIILVSLTLAFSVICLIAAIVLIIIIQDGSQSRYIVYAVGTYVGCCLLSVIVDLATALHFGADYSYVSSLLRQLTAGSPSNYRTEVIRQGAFWLMTIALKGYIAHIINIVLLALILVYLVDYQKTIKNEHSIHKLGVLNAFDQPRKPDDTWSQGDMYSNSPYRGPNANSAYVEDMTPPRSPMHPESSRNDYTNRAFDRSDSWHHNRHNSAQNARPFSYLEDIKRPVPAKLQPPPPVEPQWRREPSPVVESPWRRDPSPAIETPWRRDPWPQEPNVPAPDYSPTLPRRLKSALKPAY